MLEDLERATTPDDASAPSSSGGGNGAAMPGAGVISFSVRLRATAPLSRALSDMELILGAEGLEERRTEGVEELAGTCSGRCRASTRDDMKGIKAPPRVPNRLSLTRTVGFFFLTKLSLCNLSIRCLPLEIGCLKKLEELDLSFNKLKSLPCGIVDLSSLRALNVASNKLVDLPSRISLLEKLEKLDLSNNRLTSLVSINFVSLVALQYMNVQHNKLPNCSQVPSWICCNFEGNGRDAIWNGATSFDIDVEICDAAPHIVHDHCTCRGNHGSTFSSSSEASSSRFHVIQRRRKGWKGRDSLQQKAREERLNHSRNCRQEDTVDTHLKMVENDHSFEYSIVHSEHSELLDAEDNFFDSDRKLLLQNVTENAENINDGCIVLPSSTLNSSSCCNLKKSEIDGPFGDSYSCITSDSSASCKQLADGNLKDENLKDDESCMTFPPNNRNSIPGDHSSAVPLKYKRHSDRVLDNPKPSKSHKFHKPVYEPSCTYNVESFCSMDDHLPDGFYDAGRDRPFMSLQDYEHNLHLNSREVILLDREKDEDLDAIALSARMLISSLKSSSFTNGNQHLIDDLQRASILALFVSACLGGNDRSTEVLRLRRAAVGFNKQEPFICTCSARVTQLNSVASNQECGPFGSFSLLNLCERSIQLIKESRRSNIVPIGILQFGACRHRALLMKFLCDHADPPIPCELVRGYLDFLPHAWNAVLVKRENSWVRMIVDACCPIDIREETDPEYFCRYVPLCRTVVPLENVCPSDLGYVSSILLDQWLNEAPSRSVVCCKLGTIDAAVKVGNLETTSDSSDEKIKQFQFAFLGEVRILGALRNHSCIVELYGHRLSSKWIATADGCGRKRLLQSMIVMEYVKGGSLMNYLKLLRRSKKNVPVKLALLIARDVVCALVEVHSKLIIHRDVKSENILIDWDCKKDDGSPVVKLSDFDRSVPLHSLMHTCCIAHFGIHPPNACVGTPRWMAPEVVKAIYQRNPYGLEVDIWSYGCLLLELMTCGIPYEGQSDSEVYQLLQMQQRPMLPPELEALISSDDSNRSQLQLSIDSDVDILGLLVNLFVRCTRANPADRPTAKDIYDELLSLWVQETGNNSINYYNSIC